MSFVDEGKSFVHETEVNYPVEKIFSQFNNLQNFSLWNDYFSKSSEFSYFQPYEGTNSSMTFFNSKEKESGDLFIRYSNPNVSIRYQLFEAGEEMPFLIDVRFVPNNQKTKIIWTFYTPKRTFLKRSLNLIEEEEFIDHIDKSIKNLHALLSNKIVKEEKIASIKYDSLMIENYPGDLLLGVNVSAQNKKETLYQNILTNYGKVLSYVKTDLNKKDDEYGIPVLITNPSSLKDREISYFLGVPLSKRISVSDNNFTFQTVNSAKVYVIYYQGIYQNRVKNIQTLLYKAKKDTMRNGFLMEEFLQEPKENQEVKLKLSLPVFR